MQSCFAVLPRALTPNHTRQLTASDINFAIVRPLVFKYARLDNMAVIYACLVVRSYFLSEADSNLAYSGVSFSRATLCELLALKLLGYFASNKIQLVAGMGNMAHISTYFSAEE